MFIENKRLVHKNTAQMVELDVHTVHQDNFKDINKDSNVPGVRSGLRILDGEFFSSIHQKDSHLNWSYNITNHCYKQKHDLK